MLDWTFLLRITILSSVSNVVKHRSGTQMIDDKCRISLAAPHRESLWLGFHFHQSIHCGNESGKFVFFKAKSLKQVFGIDCIMRGQQSVCSPLGSSYSWILYCLWDILLYISIFSVNDHCLHDLFSHPFYLSTVTETAYQAATIKAQYWAAILRQVTRQK